MHARVYEQETRTLILHSGLLPVVLDFLFLVRKLASPDKSS
jgi:hypothetical protein